MRLPLLLLPALLSAADLKIDHVTVCGADLKIMRAKLESVGIKSDFGGKHSNHATEMALTSFPDGSYLESIAIQQDGDPKAIAAHEWSKEMRQNAGPCAWAVRGDRLDDEVQRLSAAGIAVTKPEKAGRNRADGTRLEWETANIGTAVRGTFFPFLIRDLTPREARAYPTGHETTSEFMGVSKVVIAVKDLDGAIAQYRKAYGWAAPKSFVTGSLHVAWFEETPVVLTTQKRSAGDGPSAIVLKLNRTPRPTSETSWWTAIRWLDESKLGWRLGVE